MKILSLLIAILLIPGLCFGAASRSFDGTDDEVDMGNVLDVSTGDVSVCAWVKTTEDASADIIVGRKNDTGTSAGYSLFQDSSDVTWFKVSDGTDTCGVSSTDKDAVWVWVCGTWNTTTDTCKIYYDGAQVGTGTNSTVGSLTNAVEFAVGEDGAEGNDLNGLVAYVSQYSGVLSVTEIAELMWKPESVGTSRGGFWPLWGASPEQDLNGSGLTGTVTGATTSTDGSPVFFNGLPL